MILYAHNFVHVISLSDKSKEPEAIICEEEQCILYSGDMDLERHLVAAGTVFRELLIWQTTDGQVLHRCKGHTGVIFDTKFLTWGHGLVLGSVSDDRSVRIWQDGQQKAEMYGHTSRIWKIAQLADQTGESQLLTVATVSEDATCKVWQVQMDKYAEVVTLRGHLGRNVRALSTKHKSIVTGGEDGAVKLW